MSIKDPIVIFLALPLLCSAFEIIDHTDSPQVSFAVQEISSVQQDSNFKIEFKFDKTLDTQSYLILHKDSCVEIRGGDATGLMYGGLEVADQIRTKNAVETSPTPATPFIKRRGLKMNIPLDARCPSYDDTGTAALMNIEQVWSKAFWYEFLDQMAIHRYNTLSLWSNHPFTAMVSLKEYPNVAIHDVAIPSYEIDDQILLQYKQAELQDPKNFKIIKKLSIDEKIEFWRDVMRYAKNRGIDIYFLTWNIWVHGAEGKYGINTSQANDNTIRYMRESVKQFILTYPDLKGIGITCGEHMDNDRSDEYSVGNWMWNTYGMGILDAKTEDPDREIHFIHRIWYTSIQNMIDDFICKYPDPISLSFKYARARLYSVPDPTFFKNQLADDLRKHSLKSWVNLRNDDIFQFRWGDPDYVRNYIKNLPDASILAGFLMGSDGYVWGREFASKFPQEPRQLEIDKHWYRFMLWGRLAYDPSLDNEYFKTQIADRFSNSKTDLLFQAWQQASKIVPLINTWHWRDWDHMWSPEICMSKKEGYHSINHFIEFKPLAGRPMQSIPEFVEAADPARKSPLDVARELELLADEAMKHNEELYNHSADLNSELNKTLNDIKAFSQLAEYYADKIRGSLSVHQFRKHGNPQDKTKAVVHLRRALSHWKAYAKTASTLYTVQLYARTSHTDWHGKLLDYAKKDIQLAEEAEHGVFPESVLSWKKKH